MEQFTMKLAGVPIAVKVFYGSTKIFCQDYITVEPPEFTVIMTQADIDLEREISDRMNKQEGTAAYYYPDSYLETLALHRKIVSRLLDYGVLLVHGSVVAVGGQAYLFSAKSGTGKTTHSKLWVKNIPGSYIINGDKPLLKVTDSGVVAYGTPWQGKENYGVNESIPLKAFCILERSATNHIEEISLKDALPIIFLQTYRPEDEKAMKKTMGYMSRMAMMTKLYRLRCNMDDEAALISYEGMR